MDLQVAEKQYQDAHAGIQEKCAWMKSLPSPDTTLDLEAAEKEYRDVCSRAQPDSSWMTAQQLRVDLLRQENQNLMLRSATSQLLSAQSDLKDELDKFRREYFTRGHEKTSRTKRMDSINQAMMEERMRWERERQALSEQLAQMITAFKGVQQAPSVQPIATRTNQTQTSTMRTPGSHDASRSGALTPRDEDAASAGGGDGSPSEAGASSMDDSAVDVHSDMDGHLGGAEETMAPQRRPAARKTRLKKRTRAERVRKRARDSDTSSGEGADSGDHGEAGRGDVSGSNASHVSTRSGSSSKRVKLSTTTCSDSSFSQTRRQAARRQRTIESDSSCAKPAGTSGQLQASDSLFAPGRPSQARGRKPSLVESDSSIATAARAAAMIESDASFAAEAIAEPAADASVQGTTVSAGDSDSSRAPTRPGGKKRTLRASVIESDASFAAEAVAEPTTDARVQGTASTGDSDSSRAPTRVPGKKRASVIESDSSFAPGIPARAATGKSKKKPSAIESDSSFASNPTSERPSGLTSPASSGRTKTGKPVELAFSPASPAAAATNASASEEGDEFIRQVASSSPQAPAVTRSPLANLHSPGVSEAKHLHYQTLSAKEAFGALLPSPIIEEEDDEELSSARATAGPSRLLQASSASPVVQSTPLRRRRAAASPGASPSPLPGRKGRSHSGRSILDSSASGFGSPSPRSLRGKRASARSPALEPLAEDPDSPVDETPFTSPGSVAAAVAIADSPAPSFGNASRVTCETVVSPGAASTTTTEAADADGDCGSVGHGMVAATSLNSVAEATLTSLSSVVSAGSGAGGKSKSKVRRSLSTLSKIVGKSGKQARRLSREGAAPAATSSSSTATSLGRRASLRLTRPSKEKADGAARRGRANSATDGASETPPPPSAELGRRKSLRRGTGGFRAMPSFPEVPARSRFAVSADGEEEAEVDEEDDVAPETDAAPANEPESFVPIPTAIAAGTELVASSAGDPSGATPNGCISFGPRRPAKPSAGKPTPPPAKRRTASHSLRIAKLLDSVQRTPSFCSDPAATPAAALLPEKPSAVVWQVAETDGRSVCGDDDDAAAACSSPLPEVGSEESLCPVTAGDDTGAVRFDALETVVSDDDGEENVDHQPSPMLMQRRSSRKGKRSASVSEVLDVETPGSKRRRERCESSDASPIAMAPFDAADTTPLHANNGRKRVRSVSHKVPPADASAAAQSSENAPQRSIRRGIKRSKSLKVGKAAAGSAPTETPRTGKAVRDADGFEMPEALVDSVQKAGKQPSIEKRRRLSRMLASAPAMSPVPGKGSTGAGRRSILRRASSRDSMASMEEPAANSTRLSMDGTATGDVGRRHSVAFSTINASQNGTGRRRALFSQRDNSFRGDVSIQSGVFGASMAATGIGGAAAAASGGGRKASSGDASNSLTQKQSMQMMMGLFRSGFKAPTVRGPGTGAPR